MQRILNKLNGRDKFFVCFNLITILVFVYNRLNYCYLWINFQEFYQENADVMIKIFIPITISTVLGLYLKIKSSKLGSIVLSFFFLYIVVCIIWNIIKEFNLY